MSMFSPLSLSLFCLIKSLYPCVSHATHIVIYIYIILCTQGLEPSIAYGAEKCSHYIAIGENRNYTRLLSRYQNKKYVVKST